MLSFANPTSLFEQYKFAYSGDPAIEVPDAEAAEFLPLDAEGKAPSWQNAPEGERAEAARRAARERLRLWYEQGTPLPLRDGQQPTVFTLRHVTGKDFLRLRELLLRLADPLGTSERDGAEVLDLCLVGVENAGDFKIERTEVPARLTETTQTLLYKFARGSLVTEMLVRIAEVHGPGK